MSYTVDVEDRVDARLTGRDGARYTSPALSAHEARELAALLLGRSVDGTPTAGTWTTAVAGGRRTVTVRCLAGEQLTLGD